MGSSRALTPSLGRCLLFTRTEGISAFAAALAISGGQHGGALRQWAHELW